MLTTRRKHWQSCIVILSALLAWEVLFRVGVVSPKRVSHPIAIFHAFFDPYLMSLFGAMFAYVLEFALVGTIVGVLLGLCVGTRSWFSRAISRFLRTTLWFPFFLLCGVPVWSTDLASDFSVLGTIAVSLYTMRRFVIVRATVEHQWVRILLEIGRAGILHAMLFAVFSQAHLVSGWIVRYFERPEISYLGVMIVGVAVLFVEWVFRTSFEDVAAVDTQLITATLDHETAGDLVGAILLSLFGIAALVLADRLWGSVLAVGAPLTILKTAHAMITGAWGEEAPTGIRVLQNIDLVISLTEIFSGIVIACMLAYLISNTMLRKEGVRVAMLRVLPMMYISPLFLSVSVSNWLDGALEIWRPLLGVALLSFFPIMKVMWGASSQSLSFRFVAGSAATLPFAFLAMIFGEMLGASKGLGFLTVVAKAQMRIDDAIAISLVTFMSFVLLSTILRCGAKYLYKH